MAGQAITAELERRVVRVRRVIERSLVALPALAVRKIVIAARVAVLARHRLVGSLKREVRRPVTEGGRIPRRGRMALGTIPGQAAGLVIRVLCLIKRALVALPAISIGQVVVAVRVAVLAGRRRVRSREGKVRGSMIERGWSPGKHRMAARAIVIELSRRVAWRPDVVEIVFVALETIRVRKLVVSIDMTILAINSLVRAFKRKLRGRVIERRGLPGIRRMTGLAVAAELAGRVVRILDGIEILFVTLLAIRVRQRVITANVAIFAIQ